MGLLFRLVELLLMIVPLIGLIFAGLKAISSLNRRSQQRDSDPAPSAPPSGKPGESGDTAAENRAAHWRAIRRAIDAHSQTDSRWLDYEIDASKLLDFPAMTDMREPSTMRFHKAKLRADLLRPLRAEDLLDDRDAARQYLVAVEDYVTAFAAAEAEAMRKRRSDFSQSEQQRLTRAQNLLRVATDVGATPQERQQAYGLARGELDGLIVLPENTRVAIERGIAGELGT
ncbi:hypothetical protein GAN17_12410 [Mycobacterium kubicae]|uniref:hypothetical protein n=1 Tax=Mycobacterium kubicae TaxID=120959 RepID=UPI0007FD2F61|nr:hypothetical protein [Mycobacterium kubicae]OBF21064.1 hypothetical protein A5725_13835 [Mycobacterium kubicae]QNI06999.1 hypothetical protein GAN17_12410 [Mycobacterium kubicae]